MNVPDFSVRAATVSDNTMGEAKTFSGRRDRNPLRTVIRIAFEVQALLASPKIDREGS